jgi:molecular chaperone IbpA
VFRSLEYFNQNTAPYPHFDVIKVDDKNYVLEMALAGYSKDSISVTVDSNILTVEGGSKEDSPKNYVRKGIAKRHFIKKMQVSDHLQCEKAKFENGMLSISLKNIREKKIKKLKVD